MSLAFSTGNGARAALLEPGLLRPLQTRSARLALGLVYVWFGALKVLGTSPANVLVVRLLARTLPGCPASGFLVAFGAAEVLLGLSFLLPGLTAISVACAVLHLCTTTLPLLLLPDMTWVAPFVPTLEGQYILKNAALLALALGLLRPAHLRALASRRIPAEPGDAPSARVDARKPGWSRSARRRVIERRAEDGVPTREVLG